MRPNNTLLGLRISRPWEWQSSIIPCPRWVSIPISSPVLHIWSADPSISPLFLFSPKKVYVACVFVLSVLWVANSTCSRHFFLFSSVARVVWGGFLPNLWDPCCWEVASPVRASQRLSRLWVFAYVVGDQRGSIFDFCAAMLLDGSMVWLERGSVSDCCFGWWIS